jgi:hypothetical protein
MLMVRNYFLLAGCIALLGACGQAGSGRDDGGDAASSGDAGTDSGSDTGTDGGGTDEPIPTFSEYANIQTLIPSSHAQGEPTGGMPRNLGGDALAILDTDNDGRLDIAVVPGGAPYFSVIRNSLGGGG